MKADFIIKAVTNGLAEGAESGTIQLKGEKFVLKPLIWSLGLTGRRSGVMWRRMMK